MALSLRRPPTLPYPSLPLPAPLSTLLASLARLDASFRALLTLHAVPLRALTEALRLAAALSPNSSSEVHAEAAAAFAALLAAYRDGARARAPRRALAAVRAVELLLEMRARAGRRWCAIASVEAVKAVLRVVLLVERGGRVLTADAEALPVAAGPPRCSCGMQGVPGAEKVLVVSGPRSGRKILRLHPGIATGGGGGGGDVLDPLFVTAYERRAAWLMRVFAQPGGCAACDGVAEEPEAEEDGGEVAAWPAPRWEEAAAEALRLLRPLLHLLLIRRWGWRSWRAWGAALAADAAARALMAAPAARAVEEERVRRNALLLLYLARSPMFDAVVLVLLRRVQCVLRRVPVVGPAAASAVELVQSVQRFWFYTAAS